MVLVDPASEDRLFTMLEGRPVLIASLSEEEVLRTVPQGPLAIPRREPQVGAPFDLLPPELYQTRVGLEAMLIAAVPDTVEQELVLASAQLDRTRLSALRRARSERSVVLQDLPLIVLSRGLDSSQGLLDSHLALAALSTNSRHVVVDQAGHEIHLFRPAAVVETILDVVAATRSDGRVISR
jgi:pimeloyl-ACP methyl ester carboxylesterase